MQKIFQSKIGNIHIEYIINNQIALMNNIYYEPSYIKNFILTLRSSIIELKNMGINKVRQMVNENDWNEFLKKDKRWKLIEVKREYYIIESDIENIFECIVQGLGIYENHTEYKTIID